VRQELVSIFKALSTLWVIYRQRVLWVMGGLLTILIAFGFGMALVGLIVAIL
jgi:hypothetical protein